MIQKLALLLPDFHDLAGKLFICCRIYPGVLFCFILVQVRPYLAIDLVHLGNILLQLSGRFIMQLDNILHGGFFIAGHLCIGSLPFFQACRQICYLLLNPLGLIVNAMLLKGDLFQAVTLPLVLPVPGKDLLLLSDQLCSRYRF